MNKYYYSVWILGILFCACHSNNPQPDKRYPSDYLFLQRSFPSGKIDHKTYIRSLELLKNYAPKTEGLDQDWESVGPFNISGRVTDIEVNFADDNILYTGAASGGILKSKDRGQNWVNVFEGMPTQAIGDLSISRSNPDFIVAGTGESNAGGGSIAYDGLGVFASEDGGDNWRHLGLDNVGSIGKVLIHPENKDILYVGAMGALFENTSARGVYKSIDGGQHWEQSLFVSDSTGIIDMAINTASPDTIFAAAWERIRRPYNRQYGGATSNIYRSFNGGEDWEILNGGLPQSADRKGRIGLAISPSSPNIIYAFYANANGSIEGIYKSEDHGTSWVEKSDEGISNVAYMWWFGRIYVHPHNPDKLFATSLRMYASDDGAETWYEVFAGAHVDHHAMGFSSIDSNLMWNGNDGGVYFSADGGASKFNYEGLNNIQFYACAIDPSDPNRLFGGAQDNGTLMTDSSTDDWRRIFGGDGFRVVVDPDNPEIIYAEAQNGYLVWSDDGGNSFSPITSSLFGQFNWNTPITMDPQNTSVLYTGSQFLFKSEDRGANWLVISPPLVNADNPMGNLSFGTLTSIDVSTLDSDIIYIGTDDGNLWVTLNGGLSYENISTDLPERWITSVKHDPLSTSGVYVTVSGFRFGEMKSQIYYSDDFGISWTDIGQSLPDIPVNDIQIDSQNPEIIYVATDAGVFVSIDKGLEWRLLGNGTEALPVIDLDYHLDGILVAATYGKGMMTYTLSEPTSLSKAESMVDILCYPNPAKDVLYLSDQGNWDYRIYDLNGRNYKVEKNENAIEINMLNPGVYYLNLISKSENSPVRSLKFVKI